MSNMSNMFDQVIPMTDEYNFISEDEVVPEQTTNPVFEDEPSFQEPLLSMSDNMFETIESTPDETYVEDFTNNQTNIK